MHISNNPFINRKGLNLYTIQKESKSLNSIIYISGSLGSNLKVYKMEVKSLNLTWQRVCIFWDVVERTEVKGT